MTDLRQLKRTAAELLADFTSKLNRLVEAMDEDMTSKQDRITGTAGQVAGFDSEGNLVAQGAGSLLGCMFSVSEEGDLLLSYVGDTVPDMFIDQEDGNLYLNFE